jgi:hypothetical protein
MIEMVEAACAIPTTMQGRILEDVSRNIDAETIRQPVGVCAAIVPFNFPAMVPFWFLPFAADAQAKRLFAVCGEGLVDIIAWRDAGRLEVVQHMATGAGARTGPFVPSTRTLFVAVPARSSGAARLLVFRME